MGTTPLSEVIAPVAPGETFAEKYRVERVLGSGGMGVVVAARHLGLGRRVAIKFLHEERAADEEAVARFAREARAAAKLKSEHVARVFDVGTLEAARRTSSWSTSRGRTSRRRSRAMGRCTVDHAVDFVLQACEAIAEAHALGIVHRDLKPANLFLTLRPTARRVVKVLDFGISKTLGVGASAIATTHHGHRRLAALHVARAARVGKRRRRARRHLEPRRHPLRAASGVPPFAAETMPQVCTKILHGPVPQLAGAPPRFADIVARCLEKDRDRRFASVPELARALAAVGATSHGTVGVVLNPRGPPAGAASPGR